MQKNKFWIVFLAFAFFGGSVFFSGVKTYAGEGKKWRPPPCCLSYKPEFPPGLVEAFGNARPLDFKILGVVSDIGEREMSINVLSIGNKTLIKDLSSKRISLDLSIPEEIDIGGIQRKDHILLIPIKSYNLSLPDKMYDFIKIQSEIIK